MRQEPSVVKDYQPQWDASSHPARLAETLEDGTVRCNLTPRHCRMAPGRAGFCGVRKNVAGRLVSLNYGRATHVTEETVETEAVYHYAPGAPTLSLGNIGCMLNCVFCQNWKTSQARFLDPDGVKVYTPQQIVDIALERDLPVLSWTYNDPVVWHEFILDTARLARQNGLRNLYKSAFYITEEGAAELCEVIDVFSISIKCLDPDFYRRLTTGTLEPVLEATKYVYGQGKHVEVSMLMVTDANDRPEDARRLAEWILENLSDQVPVHFVRFHPDYRYTHVERTPISRLEAARQAALECGIRYCYLGNVYDSDSVHSDCRECGSRLIDRYGLNARILGLDDQGRCLQCGSTLDHVSWGQALGRSAPSPREGISNDVEPAFKKKFLWHGDINALHVEARNNGGLPGHVRCRHLSPTSQHLRDVLVSAHDSFRFILCKRAPDEDGVEIAAPQGLSLRLFEVFDRAHFPTIDVETGEAESDAVPQPRWHGSSARNIVRSQQERR